MEKINPFSFFPSDPQIINGRPLSHVCIELVESIAWETSKYLNMKMIDLSETNKLYCINIYCYMIEIDWKWSFHYKQHHCMIDDTGVVKNFWLVGIV